MISHSKRPDQLPLRGIMLVLLACVLFACMDTAGKYLMTKFSVPLVAAVRYGLHLILLTALMAPPPWPKPVEDPTHGACAVARG